MLTYFTVKRIFYSLEARVIVDCERKEAWCDMTYLKVIVAQSAIPFRDVETPEKAEAWLQQPCGERGSFMEYQEWYFRSIYEADAVDRATTKVVDRAARLMAASG